MPEATRAFQTDPQQSQRKFARANQEQKAGKAESYDQQPIARLENASVVRDIVWDSRPYTLDEIRDCVRQYVPGFICEEIDADGWFCRQAKLDTLLPTKHVVRMSWGASWFQACFILECLPADRGMPCADSFVSHVSILAPDEEPLPYARSKHAIFRSMERALNVSSLPKRRSLRCNIDVSNFSVLAHDLTILLRCISWLTRCCSTKRLLSFLVKHMQTSGRSCAESVDFALKPWPTPYLQ